jgi:hypothetical protein
VKELQSIVDYERVFPAIDPIFGPTAASNHWSSTTSANSSSGAWFVVFDRGDVDVTGKDNGFFGRAVRGGPK